MHLRTSVELLKVLLDFSYIFRIGKEVIEVVVLTHVHASCQLKEGDGFPLLYFIFHIYYYNLLLIIIIIGRIKISEKYFFI